MSMAVETFIRSCKAYFLINALVLLHIHSCILASGWELSSKYETNISNVQIPMEETKVSILYTQIVRIPAQVFSHLKLCAKLLLHSNRIQDVDRDAFIGLDSLDYLHLGSNQISRIHPGTFRNLSKLITLVLHDNRLTELINGTFEGLSKLQFLYLDTNSISLIDKDVFAGMVSLRYVQIFKNKLKELPENLFRDTLSQHVTLYAHSNRITYLPNNFFHGLHNLEYLYLDIRFNMIASLPSDFFKDLHVLQQLVFRSDLTTDLLDGLLGALQNLQTLNMNENRLIHLSAELFKNLVKVELLNLHFCTLMSMAAEAFSDLTELSELVLTNNLLKSLPGRLFKNLKKLTKINLGNNRLESLPGDLFQDLPELFQVLLNHNRLSKLPWNIFKNSVNLRYIGLENNLFHVLEQFDIPETSVDIKVEGNTLSCMREMCWVLYHTELSMTGSCQSPIELQGKSIDELTTVDNKCSGTF